MTYRVICKYCPDVGTFRGKRGAWRAVDCWRVPSVHPSRTVLVFDTGREGKLLVVSSLRPRQRNSWCNPRSILTEWLEAQR